MAEVDYFAPVAAAPAGEVDYFSSKAAPAEEPDYFAPPSPPPSQGFFGEMSKGFFGGLLDQSPEQTGNALEAFAVISENPTSRAKKQLEVFDRIDRGEKVSAADDVEQYSLVPERRRKMLREQYQTLLAKEQEQAVERRPADMGRVVGGMAAGGPAVEPQTRLRQLSEAAKEYGKKGAQERKPAVGDFFDIKSATDFRDWLGYQIGQGGGTSAPIVATGLAAAAVTDNPFAFVAAAALPSYTLNLGDTYGAMRDDKDIQAAIKAGKITQKQVAQNAILAAFPMAALDTVQAEKIFGASAEKLKGNILKRMVKRALIGAVTEAPTEGGQQALQEAALEASGGKRTFEQQAKAVINSFLAGGVAGGPVAALSPGPRADETVPLPGATQPGTQPPPPGAVPPGVPPGAEPAGTIIPDVEAAPPGAKPEAADVPESPRLTTADRSSPIPNDIIDEGKAAVEDATGKPSTFTTTTEVNGHREVVTGNVADLVARDRAETQALVSQITAGITSPIAGVSPQQIATQAPQGAPPASAADVGATTLPAAPAAPARAPAAFKPGPDGYRYRVSRVGAAGGGLMLEKRSSDGDASGFYVGTDGNLFSAEEVAFNRPETLDRVWKPQPAEAAAAMEILDEMGAMPLKSPERAVLKGKLRDVVLGKATAAPAAPAGAAAATAAPGHSLADWDTALGAVHSLRPADKSTLAAAIDTSVEANGKVTFGSLPREITSKIGSGNQDTLKRLLSENPAVLVDVLRGDRSRLAKAVAAVPDVRLSARVVPEPAAQAALKAKIAAKREVAAKQPTAPQAATGRGAEAKGGTTAPTEAAAAPAAPVARQPGEDDKAFAKRVVDKRPAPKTLPEKYSDYFIMDKAQIVPIGDLVSSKTDEENRQGGGNAVKRMAAAAKGELARRGPITVEPITSGPNAGKYLITDGNGTYTSVKDYGWKAMPVIVEKGEAAAPEAAPATVQTAEAKTEGDWQKFPTGATLGIPREQMPQITADKRAGLFDFLKGRGITGSRETIGPDKLKPTQAEFSAKLTEKVANALRAGRAGVFASLISSDGYILDGHHRWTASLQTGQQMDVIRLDAPIRELLQAVSEYPGTEYRTNAQENARTEAQLKAEAALHHQTLFTGENATPIQRAVFRRHRFTTIDALYEHAQERQDELAAAGEEIAASIEGVTFENPPGGGLKAKKKAAEKIELKGYSDASQITDVIRIGFNVTHPGQGGQIIRALAHRFEMLDEGWATTPAGYFDRKALVRFKDGRIGEIQFWEPNVLRAKQDPKFRPDITGGVKDGHDLYDEWSALKRSEPQSERVEELGRQMNELYAYALSLADRAWDKVISEGKLSKPAPKYLNLMRQSASDMRLQDIETSGKSASTHLVSPGLSSALASKSVNTTGRSSQLQNPTVISETPPSTGNVLRNAPAVKQEPEAQTALKAKIEAKRKEEPRFQARVVGQGPIGATPTGGKKGERVTVRDVAQGFHEEHMAQEGRQLFPEKDAADYDHVIRDMAEPELQAQRDEKRSGVGWYQEDTANAIDVTSQLFPTLATNPEHRDLFLVFAGIFGNGPDPVTAWIAAGEAFDLFLRNGEIPVSRPEATAKAGLPVKMSKGKIKATGLMGSWPTGWTQRNAANEQHIGMFKKLVEKKGSIKAAMYWLTHPQPRSEINQVMKDAGYGDVRYPTVEDLKGPDEYGALIFGPKLGRYILGLNGIELTAEDATVDKWFVRTYRRWTGRLFEGPIDDSGIAGQPNPKEKGLERRTIFRMVGDLAKRFNLKPTDVQAILWFHEQRLYDASGVPTEAGTNTDGAYKLLEQRGVQPVRQNDNARSDVAGDQAGREDELPRATQFVSPNVATGGDLTEAVRGIASVRQRALLNVSKVIDQALGIVGFRRDAVGAWSDGAENTTVDAVANDVSWETLKVAAAMKGHLADQKQVLIFKQEDGGTSSLHRMRVPETNVRKLRENLVADGIVFHTLVLHKDGTDVIVAVLDGSGLDAMERAAERYNANVTTQVGRADFIGTETQDNDPRSDREQRDDARRAYEEVISQSPVQGAQQHWARIHDHWGQTLEPRHKVSPTEATSLLEQFQQRLRESAAASQGVTRTHVTGGVIQYRLRDEFKAKAAKLVADLQPLLEKLAPGVPLRVFETISGYINGQHLAIDGQYFKGVVDLALNIDDPEGTVYHEAVHALWDYFTPTEQAILTRKSNREWRDRYEIAKNYGAQSEKIQIEEGVAHAITAWRNGARMDGVVAKAFKKFMAIARAIGSVLIKHDIRAAEDIFADVASGKIGKRLQARDAGGRFGGPESLFQIAWHGSKAKFIKFGQEFFGTGQGQQWYGRGFYFARGGDRRYAATFGDYVYEVDIPDTENMLEWGEKLTNQPKGVQEKLEPLWKELGERVPDNYDQEIYHWIGEKLTGDQGYRAESKAAADRLDELGIPGIAFERRGQQGAVVFNADNIAITSVNGEKLADATGNEPRFHLTSAPHTAQQSQQTMQGFLSRGQFVDRAIRLPLQFLGGLDEQNRWRPTKRLKERLGPQRIEAGSLSGVLGASIGFAFGGPVGGAIGGAVGMTAGGLILGSKVAPVNGQFAWLKSIGENAKRGLMTNYGLDPEYVEAFRKSDLGKTQILRQAAGIMKVLHGANVGTAEAKVLQQILSGTPVNDADMIRISEPIRQAIDALGAEAVSEGLISAESFERNRGAYLHRVYTKHEIDPDTNKMAAWVSKQMASRRRRIIGDSLKGRGMFWDLTVERLMQDAPNRPIPGKGDKWRVIDRTSADGKVSKRVFVPADKPVPVEYTFPGWVDRGEWEVRQVGGVTSKAGPKAPGAGSEVTLWRDYTEAERGQMGEIVDARYTITKTFMLMANDLSTGKFYREVSEKAQWTQTAEPPAHQWKEGGEYGAANGRYWTDPEIQWVKVPDTNIGKTGGKKKWGKLAGKFVRAEIWRDLNEINIAHNPGIWRKLFRQWKTNKTARHPVVHMNNIMSNVMFMDMADIRTQDLMSGINAYFRGTKDYDEALQNGAFGSSMLEQELRDSVLKPILAEIAQQQKTRLFDPLLGKIGVVGDVVSKIWEWAKYADDRMLHAYKMEDEVFRMAAYMRRRSQGATPEEAGIEARDQFLDYDIRAPWVVAMRNTFLPFISYTYRAVPKLAQNILDRPWKVMKYVAIAAAVNALSYMLDGDDDDDEKRERASMRNEEQGYTWLGTPRMIRMPWRDSHGMPVFFDIRRWIPAGDVFDSAPGQAALPIPAPLNFGGPLQLAYEFMLNKKSFDGQSITNELTDDMEDKASNVFDWAWKSWAPASFWTPNSWYWTKIANAYYGAKDPAGNVYSLPQAVLSSVGVKVKGVDVEQGIMWHFRDFKKVINELKYQMKDNARDLDRGLISQKSHDARQADLLRKVMNTVGKIQDFSQVTRKKPAMAE